MLIRYMDIRSGWIMTAVQLLAILGFGFLAMILAIGMAIYMLKVSQQSE